MRIWMSIFFCMLLPITVGCAHSFSIKNLDDYRVSASSLESVEFVRPVALGIRLTTTKVQEERYADSIVSSLRESRCVRRATTNVRAGTDFDYIADVDLRVNQRGSIANFLVSFPGFLVWAPAWHGFVYGESIVADVKISDLQSGEAVGSFREEVDLDLRHAEMDRTWIELSWLEFGVIAFVGGLYNTSFDGDIDDKASLQGGKVVGKYLASKILGAIQDHQVALGMRQEAPEFGQLAADHREP